MLIYGIIVVVPNEKFYRKEDCTMTVALLVIAALFVLGWKILVFLGGSVVAMLQGKSLEAGKDTFKKVLGCIIVVMVVLAIMLPIIVISMNAAI